jgi:asparagine synthase (glutamine-hydrolysing)
MMVRALGSEHREVVVGRRAIAEIFPDVVFHAERPILRTAPAPMFLLSRLVRDESVKVVVTGEGADEMFAGYDLFREGKVRRFWARHPDSALRPRLLERLYPYLARSPVAQRGIARRFFGRSLERSLEPGFAHETRWNTTSALKRLFAPALIAALDGHDARAVLLADLPAELPRWAPLAQDQYLEIRTLLAGSNSGGKNGTPTIWSRWLWVRNRSISCGARVLRSSPSGRRPVPASNTSRWDPQRISRQEVLPP